MNGKVGLSRLSLVEHRSMSRRGSVGEIVQKRDSQILKCNFGIIENNKNEGMLSAIYMEGHRSQKDALHQIRRLREHTNPPPPQAEVRRGVRCALSCATAPSSRKTCPKNTWGACLCRDCCVVGVLPTRQNWI